MIDEMLARRKSIGKIRFYTHSFIIYTACDRAATAALQVAELYSEKKWVKEKNIHGDFFNRQVIDKVYGTIFPDNKTFQFHKGQLKDYTTAIRGYGLTLDDFEIEIMDAYNPSKLSYALKEGRVLRDYQINAKEFSLAPVKEADHFSKLVAMPTGTGKALSEDTLVKSIRGPVRMGDLVVGDEILAPDGTFTTVLGIYPQGLKNKYDVTFFDGRVVEADAEHLWTVFPNGRKESTDWTTEKIARNLKKYTVRNVLYNPVDAMDAEEYISLYEELKLIVRCRGVFLDQDPVVSAYLKCTDVDQVEQAIEVIQALGGWAFEVHEFEDTYIEFAIPRMAEEIYDWIIPDEDEAETIAISREEYVAMCNDSRGIPIRSIAKNGVSEMICIEVDHHSNLFVLDNWIVTHNTVTSCGIAAEEKTRWMVSILPKYKEKWAGDIVANLNLKEKEVMVIDSTDGLRGIIDYCKKHGTKKLQAVLVVTLTTLATFFKSWQKDPEGCIEDYGCEPMELWKILDIGTVSVDESHEHIYSVFLLAMHLHGPKFISMSGTMQSEEPFQEKIQNLVFPEIKRYNDVKMAKYINVEYLEYTIHREIRHKVRYQVFGRQDYSHVEFEKSIMRHPRLLKDFLDMYACIVDYGYIQRKEQGDKILIYAATVDMVNVLMKDFMRRWPTLDIRRYAKTEKDDYDEFINAEMAISTLQSSGTAVDVPNLISVLCTTMVNSGKTNLQALGRLRDLFGKHMFMFLPYCRDIRKHLGYTAYRAELFKDRVKSMKTARYFKPLGAP